MLNYTKVILFHFVFRKLQKIANMKFVCFPLSLLGLLCLLDGTVGSPAALNVGSGLVRTKRGELEDYKLSCGQMVELEPGHPVVFKSPMHGKGKNYAANAECSWSFVGTNECQPEVSCSELDIRKVGNDCEEEHLKIGDGIGGEVKLCGSAAFTKSKKASKGGRDLYINFKAGESAKFDKTYKGFQCEAKCSRDKGASAEALPPNGPTRKEEFKCVCGLQNKDDRIVGGEDAKMNEFPWQAAIVRPGTRSPMCGGSVINNRYILTAAHCFWFAKMKPDQIEVLIHAHVLDFTITKAEGSVNIKLGEDGSFQGRGHDFALKTDKDENTQRFKVLEIINHPLFTAGYDYDVALLKLDRKIDLLSDTAPTPICLPPHSWYDHVYEGIKPWVVGWGLPHEIAGATTRLLQKLEVPVIRLQTCKDMMPHELTDRMLCAGYEEGNKDACTGDSGGPLSYKKTNKQWEQIGIVSWGEGCARAERPGLYSRVTEFIQWINQNTQAPGTIWCRETKN